MSKERLDYFQKEIKRIEETFIQLQRQRVQITEELLKLQGEARVFQKLIEKEKPKDN